MQLLRTNGHKILTNVLNNFKEENKLVFVIVNEDKELPDVNMNTITRTQRHVCQQEIHNSGLS
jgi:hypothetical protein